MPTDSPPWRPVATPCRGQQSAAAAPEVRCDCGSLLARWTAAGLELKCRRCKRHVIVPCDEVRPPPHP